GLDAAVAAGEAVVLAVAAVALPGDRGQDADEQDHGGPDQPFLLLCSHLSFFPRIWAAGAGIGSFYHMRGPRHPAPDIPSFHACARSIVRPAGSGKTL